MNNFNHDIILNKAQYEQFLNTFRLNIEYLREFLVSKIHEANAQNELIFCIQNFDDKEQIFTKIAYLKGSYVYFEKFNLLINDFECFVFDMGGTLLDSKKMLQNENIKKVNELARIGKKIVIATSGSYFNFENYFEKINFNMPLICANGAMIYDNKTLKLTSGLEMLKEEANEIMNKCNELGLAYYIFHDSGMAGINVENSSAYKQNKEATGMKKESWVLNPESNFFDDKKIYKVFVTFEREQIEKIKVLISFCKKFKKLHTMQTHSNFLDIGIACSKASALNNISNEHKINLSKTIVFGDSDNDLPLFDIAKVSFTHSSARLSVLKSAHYVSSKNNNENWISWLIDNLFV
ncbi:HAD-IIB family hydrolase [Mycoplasmopsis agalactiae]|uniref:HAD-IIB family hydrolase n=1 Tax=Mycoplasmopsis agalactiae TaxID=2110 RepID=UPI001FA05C71|nr:HAD-IIB family hydrolase [Mycoplasmopsis agalactiae]MCE6115377.1 HAD-IIB family hydrolase [Mycoplasmopsis agalactiae]